MTQDSNPPTTTAHSRIKVEEQPTTELSSSSTNHLKRKTPPVDDGTEINGSTAVVLNDDGGSADGDADEQEDVRVEPRGTRSPPSFPGRPGEYEAGRIDCPSCHKQVAFRDEETGEFSLKRWQQHWESCAVHNQASSNRSPPTPFTQRRSPHNLMSSSMNVYRPGSDDVFPAIMAHPPTKRRRAKRTEEERVAYLRADPYVAEFEAYRVLCASCDKWIRLRPNSTYCSIPWDAHRKSCLSKKISNKNTYALDERNSLFSKDPDVRKFDAERVLCAVCDQWIPINSEDHLQAVKTWLGHRGECAKRAAAVSGVSGPGTSSSGAPREHSNIHPPSHMHMSGRLPSPRPFSPPRRDMDPYRYRHQPHHSYSQSSQSVVRRGVSPDGRDAPRARHHRDNSRIKPELREMENSQQVDVDADGDPDADADAEGDPESELDSNQIRVVDLSRPPPGQILITENNDEKPLASNVLTHKIDSAGPPLEASAPSIEGGSQSEPVVYSPAAGIFPPGPAHESRRRNAEQRAATLRADPLIKHVEPNRVFCSLCEKWVQLRQDSSFCAYPWFQHRGKCLARYQRRAQKAAEIEEIKKRRAMGGPSARNMHAYDGPQGYPPPYPPRSHHLSHPSTSHHGQYTYPAPPPPHVMHTQENRLTRGHPRHGEEDGLAYFSGSDQGRSDEDDGMSIRFAYRGLSVSASPASEGRSGSVGSVASGDEGQGPEYAMLEEAEYGRSQSRRMQPQHQDEKAEPEVDPDVDCSDAHRNVGIRPDSTEDKVRKEAGADGKINGSGEANKQGPSSTSQTQVEISTPGSRPPTRHRAIAPREAPLLMQPPRPRAEMNTNQTQDRRAQPSHSLVPVLPHVLPGKSYHNHGPNGGPGSGFYRSSQHQREREYMGSRSHIHPYGGKISREKPHRVHREHSQSRFHGPYGNGVLSSSSTSVHPSGRGALADLDSPAGRKQFVSHSIAYLFQTTYDCSPCSSDELSISALVAYLNAAMPIDKHEDFDTAEVVRCVGALREKGRILLEGDVVRKVRRDHD